MGLGRRGALRRLAGGTLGAALLPRPGSARGEGAARLVETGPRDLPALPAFTGPDGRPATLAGLAGRGVVLNLWATWCPPCVAEMPSLDRLAEGVEGAGILVLPLSSDRGGRAQVEPFYRRLGLRRLGLWLDPGGGVQRALGVRELPTTLLLDRAGRERARLVGPAEWDDPALVAAVRRLAGAEGARTG